MMGHTPLDFSCWTVILLACLEPREGLISSGPACGATKQQNRLRRITITSVSNINWGAELKTANQIVFCC